MQGKPQRKQATGIHRKQFIEGVYNACMLSYIMYTEMTPLVCTPVAVRPISILLQIPINYSTV
eukprot:9171-Heterococcus_DN1.PRE.3